MDDKDVGKLLGKREVEFDQDENISEAENSAVEDTEKKPTKRARIRWTAELHKKFVDAVYQLGVADASPFSIMTLMNVDGLTQSIVATHLKKFRRSRREQRWSETEGGAQQASEGGNSGIDTDNGQMGMKGFNVPDAHKVFDKMPQRTWDSKSKSSCATQITVSSSASQHEVSSASVSAANSRRFDEDEEFKRPMDKDKFLSWLLEEDAAPVFTPLLLDFDANPSVPLAPGGSRYPIADKMDWKNILSPTVDQQITNSSAAIQEPFFGGMAKLWSSNFTPDDRLVSVFKFVLNIVRWKRRALSRHLELLKNWDDQLWHIHDSDEQCVGPTRLTEFPLYMDLDYTSSIFSDPFHFDASLLDDSSLVDDALHYCALFPPGHEFEKDTLVQVWVALGFFVHEPMERFASQLFDKCFTKGYFHFLRTNLVTGKAMYKFIQKSQSLPLSTGSLINLSMVSPVVTHASIRCCDLKGSTALLDFRRFKQLRALIFLHGHELSFNQVPRNFFLSLRELQVLDLSKTCLMELPTSIGNMKCLCLLDLSDTLIKRLPEAICCLEKLQTLKLKGCLNITTLPKGMRKLVNLRHLDFDVFRQLRSMPEGMGDLTNIQTLSAFVVSVEDGCSIRQIKNMNNLSGSFCISRLENVLTKDEADEACLSNKTQLKKIELHWSDSPDEDVESEKVLSSLQPNTSLEELNISCYGGLELPSWICDPKFSQLACITLFECENCLVLPSLGQLPCLKYLNIVNFHKLKVIDHNFYGDLGIQGYAAFPKLEKLTIENMFSLEEWLGIRSFEFPCLLNLTVKHCPKLHNLCTLSSLCSLKNLEISHCAMLASCPDDKLPARVKTVIIESCPLISARFLNGGQDSQYAAHIPHIWIDHGEISLG